MMLCCRLPCVAVSYLEELEKRFQEDPKSVDRTWGAFFTNLSEQWAMGAESWVPA
jgi:2-oxoglutarate dehydrogenase complex dehydrogenase (E1) component-like enzyme